MTPDLGEKMEPPEYIQSHFEKFADKKMKEEINKNIS